MTTRRRITLPDTLPDETSRQRWVRRTRESVLREMAKEGVPLSAGALEGSLDITTYYSSLGFIDMRSAREISAALRHLEQRGFLRRLDKDERTPDDPPGVLYECTCDGYEEGARLREQQIGRTASEHRR